MRDSMNAYLVFGHLPRKVEEIQKRAERIIKTAGQQTRYL